MLPLSERTYQMQPTCPYCGKKYTPMIEPNNGDSDVISCDCGEKFRVYANATIEYSSYEVVD